MTLEVNKIYQGDCLEVMKEIEDKSINMILCDLPYGTTACSWDIVIPLDKLWKQYERVLKDNGVIVLTASQPFTSLLVTSNIQLFKHNWVWDKIRGVGHLLAKKRPMMCTEDILIFYRDLNERKSQISSFIELREYFRKILNSIYQTKKVIVEIIGQRADHCFRWNSTQWDLPTEETYNALINTLKIDSFNFFKSYNQLKKEYEDEESRFKNITYNPQMRERDRPRKSLNKGNTECYSGDGKEFNGNILDKKYPINILRFSKSGGKDLLLHPTQKPVKLFEYLIKTYSNKRDLILDNCIGSGTTAIACKRLNRRFIGIEKEEKYVNIAKKRLSQDTLTKLQEGSNSSQA